MKFRSLAVIALSALWMVPATAQDQQRQGPVFNRDVTSQPLIPAPESGNIILKFGESSRVHFKHPIKAIRIDDEYAVKAVPETDHVVLFTGLAPGKSSISIESKEGQSSTWGVVTIVRELHDVKIYRPAQTNSQSGELRRDSTDNSSGYIVLRCNEIGCENPPEKAK